MYSRSAKGGEKGDPNSNPWLAKMDKYMQVVVTRLYGYMDTPQIKKEMK
jgi:hypothetical protein